MPEQDPKDDKEVVSTDADLAADIDSAPETNVPAEMENEPTKEVTEAKTPEPESDQEEDQPEKTEKKPTTKSIKEDDETTIYDDDKTDRLVDAIAAEDADELLAAQDAAAAHAEGKVKPKGGNIFQRWWRNKPARYITLLILLGGIVAVLAIPSTRYWLMNALGIRVTSSFTVVDDATKQPLKNVDATLQDKTVQTNSDGVAHFTELKQGKTQLHIAQPGFTSISKQVTLGWGSNPLGTFGLQAVGVQFTVLVRDFLTARGIEGAEVANGQATARSDKDGKAVLTLEGSAGTADVPITVSKDGYRSQQATIPHSAHTFDVNLITSRQAVYVGRQNGTYDVFKSDIDGQNKQLLLAGTGSENANISLVTSVDGSHAALVSTRGNQKDTDGFLLSTLTLIDVNEGTNSSLATAEQVQLIDWIGTRLVFEQIAAGSNKASIISYDYASNSRVLLATGSHFNAVFSAQGTIYYALKADPNDPSAHAAFYKINPDGTGKQTALDQEVLTGQRTDYNTFNLQTASSWYTYAISSGDSKPISGPASLANRMYIDNSAVQQSLWSENREGQGTLLVYSTASAKDLTAAAQSGLTYPVRWLTNDTAIYRVAGGESADYAVSLLGGGTAHKIADVVNTYGFSPGT